MRDFMVRSFHMKEALATANALHILQYLDTETDVSYLMSQLATAGVRFENDQQFRNFAVLLNRMKSTARFWGFAAIRRRKPKTSLLSAAPCMCIKWGAMIPVPAAAVRNIKSAAAGKYHPRRHCHGGVSP